MRTLVLVRHGQTDWNAEERFQGQLDIPLNTIGRRQAEAVKLHLEATAFDVAYSSPLIRALETARIIAGGLPISADARLTEIHHGSWQGKTKREIAELWPDQWNRSNTEPLRFTPPGGESAERVRSRVENFLHTIQGTQILCVSHGVVIQTFLSILLGGASAEPDEYVPKNGSIHTFSFRDGEIAQYRIDMFEKVLSGPS